MAISSEVKLVGRFAGVNSDKVRFSGSLRNVCELSDLKMDRLLDTIDAWAEAHDVEGEGELT